MGERAEAQAVSASKAPEFAGAPKEENWGGDEVMADWSADGAPAAAAPGAPPAAAIAPAPTAIAAPAATPFQVSDDWAAESSDWAAQSAPAPTTGATGETWGGASQW